MTTSKYYAHKLAQRMFGDNHIPKLISSMSRPNLSFDYNASESSLTYLPQPHASSGFSHWHTPPPLPRFLSRKIRSLATETAREFAPAPSVFFVWTVTTAEEYMHTGRTE